ELRDVRAGLRQLTAGLAAEGDHDVAAGGLKGTDLRGEGADSGAVVLPLRRAAGLRDEEGQRVVLQAGSGLVGGHVPGVRRVDLQVGGGEMGGEGGAGAAR